MDDVSLVTEISFVGRNGGKDEYDVICTITKAGNTKSESSRVAYSGERIELSTNEFGTVYMQPRAK